MEELLEQLYLGSKAYLQLDLARKNSNGQQNMQYQNDSMFGTYLELEESAQVSLQQDLLAG